MAALAATFVHKTAFSLSCRSLATVQVKSVNSEKKRTTFWPFTPRRVPPSAIASTTNRSAPSPLQHDIELSDPFKDPSLSDPYIICTEEHLPYQSALKADDAGAWSDEVAALREQVQRSEAQSQAFQAELAHLKGKLHSPRVGDDAPPAY